MEKADIEELIRSGKTVEIVPDGQSMFPLFVQGRGDSAVIRQATDDDIRTGAVCLYRRAHGGLVIHRVCKVGDDGIYFVGDNQTEVEGPLKREQVIGVMEGFVRNGKRRSVKAPLYLIYSYLWLLVRPVRHTVATPARIVYRMIHKEKGDTP